MNKRKFSVMTVGFTVLIILAVALLMVNNLRRSSHIELPAAASAESSSASSEQETGGGAAQIAVTPSTVQTAVATLTRPEKYVRALTVEYLWDGGSGTFQSTVYVSGAYVRTDTTQTDGRIRHSITDGTTTYVWYNSGKSYFSGKADVASADQEQHIPTYEDLLNLDAKQIASADYRTFSGENCIFAETAKDSGGYVQRYWVSVATGLLLGAEKLQNGETVYRMAAQPVSGTVPATADFTLPDGKVLHKVS